MKKINHQHKSQIESKVKKWTTWIEKSKFFARGGFAKVYRKDKQYPCNFFRRRGEIVKVLGNSLIPNKNGKAQYWEMKLCHFLFPKYFPKVTGFRQLKDCFEIHMEEVPMHKELKNYMDYLSDSQATGHRWGEKYPKGLELYKKLPSCYSSSKTMIALKEIEDAGIYPELENNTNFSIAKENPIFFEPRISYSPSTKLYILNFLSGERQKRALNILKRLENARSSKHK
jgi:hypothetical protein